MRARDVREALGLSEWGLVQLRKSGRLVPVFPLGGEIKKEEGRGKKEEKQKAESKKQKARGGRPRRKGEKNPYYRGEEVKRILKLGWMPAPEAGE